MRVKNLLLLGSILLFGGSLSGCNESTANEGNSKVFKSSGAVQCQPDSGAALEDMQMEFVNAGIDVVCAQTGSDGGLYPAVCGGRSGAINVYEIRSVNVEDAQALGFASVMTLPDYVGQVCE